MSHTPSSEADPDLRETALVAAWKCDPRGFDALVEAFAPFVLAVARRRCRDAELARESAQNVFAALHRKGPDAFTARPGRLVAWLHRAAVLETLALARKERRLKARESAYAATLALAAGEHAAAWQIDEALARLPSADRQLLLQHYAGQRSWRELAAHLGTSEEATRKRASRAVEKLRTALGRRGQLVPVAAVTTALAGLATASASAGGFRFDTTAAAPRSLWSAFLKAPLWSAAAGLAAAVPLHFALPPAPEPHASRAVSADVPPPPPSLKRPGASALDRVWREAMEMDVSDLPKAVACADARPEPDQQRLALLAIMAKWAQAEESRLPEPDRVRVVDYGSPFFQAIEARRAAGDERTAACLEDVQRRAASPSDIALEFAATRPDDVLWAATAFKGNHAWHSISDTIVRQWPAPWFRTVVERARQEGPFKKDSPAEQVLQAWAKHDPEGLWEWAGTVDDPEWAEEARMQSVYLRAWHHAEDTAKQLFSGGFAGLSEKNAAHLRHVALSGWTDQAPLRALDFCAAVSPTETVCFGNTRASYVNLAMQQLATDAPEAGAAWVEAHSDLPEAAPLLARAWARTDAAAAMRWIASLPPHEARDAAVLAALPLAGDADPPTVWQWALAVKTPGLRERALRAAAQIFHDHSPAEAAHAVQAAALNTRDAAAVQPVFTTTP